MAHTQAGTSGLSCEEETPLSPSRGGILCLAAQQAPTVGMGREGTRPSGMAVHVCNPRLQETDGGGL